MPSSLHDTDGPGRFSSPLRTFRALFSHTGQAQITPLTLRKPRPVLPFRR